MRSRASVFSHPIHPILVNLPIGLFVWTFVADLVYLGTNRQPEWYDISFWSGIAATVSALVAALPGFVDYFFVALDSNARGIATAHMLLNLLNVGLFFAAIMVMLDRNAASGDQLAIAVALHGAGVAVLMVAGLLGGELTFRHHIAVIPESAEAEMEERARHIERPRYGPRRLAG